MQESVTKRDRRLREESSTRTASAHASQTGPRNGIRLATDQPPQPKNSASAAAAAAVPLPSISAEVGNARSGSDYYKKWETVAESELKKLDDEDAAQPRAALEGACLFQRFQFLTQLLTRLLTQLLTQRLIIALSTLDP